MKHNSKLLDMLTGYTAAHQHPVNIGVHMVGIPTIMLGLFIPLSWATIEIDGLSASFAEIALLAIFVFYLTLDWIFALTFLLIGYLIAQLAAMVGTLPTPVAGTIAAVAFAGGWIAQFIGHAIEKSMPVVLKHPVQAHLAAPFFTVVELFKFAGLRDKLFNEIQRRIADVNTGQTAQ
jgi:uncharacterized membrane protein YGL010W